MTIKPEKSLVPQDSWPLQLSTFYLSHQWVSSLLADLKAFWGESLPAELSFQCLSSFFFFNYSSSTYQDEIQPPRLVSLLPLAPPYLPKTDGRDLCARWGRPDLWGQAPSEEASQLARPRPPVRPWRPPGPGVLGTCGSARHSQSVWHPWSHCGMPPPGEWWAAWHTGQGQNVSRPAPLRELWRGTRSEAATQTAAGLSHPASAGWHSSKALPCWERTRRRPDVESGLPALKASRPSASPPSLAWTTSQWGMGVLLHGWKENAGQKMKNIH